MKRLPNSKLKRLKVNLWLYGNKVGGYIVFLITVLALSWLFDKFFEALCIIGTYTATRFCVPKIKHFDTTQKCISVSTLTFIFALAILCIPKNVSIIWSVAVGACIPLIMYAESLLFEPKSDKDELIDKCKALNYNPLKTQMAVKFFVENQKPKEVWLWLCDNTENPIEWDSVKKMKYRMKKDLFK